LYGRPLRLFYSLLLSPADERLAGALVNELRHTPFMSYAIFHQRAITENKELTEEFNILIG
jgi:hypothetical protein